MDTRADNSKHDNETDVDLCDFSVDEYYEYDCGYPCTPNGCCGHTTDIPLSFSVAGVTFQVYGAQSGDFPDSKENIKLVCKVVKAIEQRLSRCYQPDTVKASNQ